MLVDIIVVVLVLGFILIGWKRGFLLSIYSLFSVVIAIILACVLSSVVSSGIQKTGLPNKLETKISSYVETELTEKFGANADVNAEQAAEELPLPEFIAGKIADSIKENAAQPIQSISKSIGVKSADFVCSVIAFTLVFFIVMVAMIVIRSVLKLATKLPVIKQADTVGGILIGFAEGVLLICVLALLLSIFSSAECMRPIVSAVEGSHIAKYIYETNFIGKFISGLL